MSARQLPLPAAPALPSPDLTARYRASGLPLARFLELARQARAAAPPRRGPRTSFGGVGRAKPWLDVLDGLITAEIAPPALNHSQEAIRR